MAGTHSPPSASHRSCARRTGSAVRERRTADQPVATSRPSSTGSRASATTVRAGTSAGDQVPSAWGSPSYGGGNGAGSRATSSTNASGDRRQPGRDPAPARPRQPPVREEQHEQRDGHVPPHPHALLQRDEHGRVGQARAPARGRRVHLPPEDQARQGTDGGEQRADRVARAAVGDQQAQRDGRQPDRGGGAERDRIGDRGRVHQPDDAAPEPGQGGERRAVRGGGGSRQGHTSSVRSGTSPRIRADPQTGPVPAPMCATARDPDAGGPTRRDLPWTPRPPRSTRPRPLPARQSGSASRPAPRRTA